MKLTQIGQLREVSRKLVRELGMLQVDQFDAGITPGHWHALIEIDRAAGITISKLADLLLMSISKMSRIVNTLKKSGLLELRAGIDKREKYLYVTIDGKNEIKKIDKFSVSKVIGAFDFLNESEILSIVESISKYAGALEKSRLKRDCIKIATLSTSRPLRRQIVSMISNIQKNEFSIPISDETNLGILKAEHEYYYDNSYNFWYAVNEEGRIIGSIGLKKVDSKTGEIKKFFVISEYRGKGVAQKLMNTLIKSSIKHGFQTLYLGTVGKLYAAQKFYKKSGFNSISREHLPNNFEICSLDSHFFKCDISDLKKSVKL